LLNRLNASTTGPSGIGTPVSTRIPSASGRPRRASWTTVQPSSRPGRNGSVPWASESPTITSARGAGPAGVAAGSASGSGASDSAGGRSGTRRRTRSSSPSSPAGSCACTVATGRLTRASTRTAAVQFPSSCARTIVRQLRAVQPPETSTVARGEAVPATVTRPPTRLAATKRPRTRAPASGSVMRTASTSASGAAVCAGTGSSPLAPQPASTSASASAALLNAAPSGPLRVFSDRRARRRLGCCAVRPPWRSTT
jgi:hypothetical protein